MVAELPVNMQGYKLKIPEFLLTIAGAKMILEIIWLATLGAHMVDYSTFQFNYGIMDSS